MTRHDFVRNPVPERLRIFRCGNRFFWRVLEYVVLWRRYFWYGGFLVLKCSSTRQNHTRRSVCGRVLSSGEAVARQQQGSSKAAARQQQGSSKAAAKQQQSSSRKPIGGPHGAVWRGSQTFRAFLFPLFR